MQSPSVALPLASLLLWADSLPHWLIVPARHAENVTNFGANKYGYLSRAPLPKLAELSPNSAEFPFLTTWLGLRVTPSVREWSAKWPLRSHVTSVMRGEKTRFLQILFNKWLFQETYFISQRVQKPSSTLLQCQSLPTSSVPSSSFSTAAYSPNFQKW